MHWDPRDEDLQLSEAWRSLALAAIAPGGAGQRCDRCDRGCRWLRVRPGSALAACAISGRLHLCAPEGCGRPGGWCPLTGHALPAPGLEASADDVHQGSARAHYRGPRWLAQAAPQPQPAVPQASAAAAGPWQSCPLPGTRYSLSIERLWQARDWALVLELWHEGLPPAQSPGLQRFATLLRDLRPCPSAAWVWGYLLLCLAATACPEARRRHARPEAGPLLHSLPRWLHQHLQGLLSGRGLVRLALEPGASL